MTPRSFPGQLRMLPRSVAAIPGSGAPQARMHPAPSSAERAEETKPQHAGSKNGNRLTTEVVFEIVRKCLCASIPVPWVEGKGAGISESGRFAIELRSFRLRKGFDACPVNGRAVGRRRLSTSLSRRDGVLVWGRPRRLKNQLHPFPIHFDQSRPDSGEYGFFGEFTCPYQVFPV